MALKFSFTFCLIALVFFVLPMAAQQQNKAPEKNIGWKKIGKIGEGISLRMGGGVEKTLYREIGLAYAVQSWLKGSPETEGAWHSAAYTTFASRANQVDGRPIYGVRVGVEGSNLLLGEAVEISYFWNNPYSKNQLVFTPKIGLNALGILGIYYGYNFYSKTNPFSRIMSHHQFSVSTLVNYGMLKSFWKH